MKGIPYVSAKIRYRCAAGIMRKSLLWLRCAKLWINRERRICEICREDWFHYKLMKQFNLSFIWFYYLMRTSNSSFTSIKINKSILMHYFGLSVGNIVCYTKVTDVRDVRDVTNVVYFPRNTNVDHRPLLRRYEAFIYHIKQELSVSEQYNGSPLSSIPKSSWPRAKAKSNMSLDLIILQQSRSESLNETCTSDSR